MKEFDEERFFMEVEHRKHVQNREKMEELEIIFETKKETYNKTKKFIEKFDKKLIAMFLGYIAHFEDKIVYNKFIAAINNGDCNIEVKVTYILQNKLKDTDEICRILENSIVA